LKLSPLHRLLPLLLAAFFCIGCGDEVEDDPRPDLLEQAHLWGEVSIGGRMADLYASRPVPIPAITEIYLYFPVQTPTDPATATLRPSLYLTDPLPNPDTTTTLDNLPEGFILAAPTDSLFAFDPQQYLFTGCIVPFAPGSWTLQLTWESLGTRYASYLPLTVNRPAVEVPVKYAGNWRQLAVLAWREPSTFQPGSREFRITTWSGRDLGQSFAPDTTISLTLLLEPLPPDTLPDTVLTSREGADHMGTLDLPDRESWTFRVVARRDTTPVGEAVFQFRAGDTLASAVTSAPAPPR
jgi:hypothetical protein